MNYSFHPYAKDELKKAVDYYNKCGAGLGHIFLDEIEATIQRIIEFPEAWTTISNNTRRCLARRFPYGVIYQIVDDDNILIVAVMHLKTETQLLEKQSATLLSRQDLLTVNRS